MASLPDIARSTADRLDMLPAGSVVVAMVSGGADSTALLRLLASGSLGRELHLSVLHLDHGLRGAESAGDARFVVELCDALGLPCRVVTYDVAAYAAEEELNLEDAGRRVRYRFAEEETDARCEQAGVPLADGRIAVAHTLDDRLETLVMRLATGSGTGALAGILPVRDRIVRPLIEARRADVVAYLTELGQEWREDATNADTSRTRALVRHEVMPALERVNPCYDEALARIVAVLAEEDAYLRGVADAAAADVVTVRDGRVEFDCPRASALARPIVRRMVRSALTDTFPEASRIEAAHLEALVDGMAEDGWSRDLPAGLRGWNEYGTLMVARRGGEGPSVAPSLLHVPGTTDLGEAGCIVVRSVRVESRPVDRFSAVIDSSKVVGPLIADEPRPGDRMRPLGMKGRKKLSDLMTDEKVPRRLRGVTPVVRDGERIVWVAGVRVSDEYRVDATTVEALQLTWVRDE